MASACRMIGAGSCDSSTTRPLSPPTIERNGHSGQRSSPVKFRSAPKRSAAPTHLRLSPPSFAPSPRRPTLPLLQDFIPCCIPQFPPQAPLLPRTPAKHARSTATPTIRLNSTANQLRMDDRSPTVTTGLSLVLDLERLGPVATRIAAAAPKRTKPTSPLHRAEATRLRSDDAGLSLG